MRKLKLFIACSIDGFIARENGDVEWLFTDADYGYDKFYKTIDTTLMGKNTYKKILTFGEFPYKDKINYVFAHQAQPKRDNVEFIQKDATYFVKNLKNKPTGSDIWLIGGGQIISLLHNHALIDEYILAIHPIILGEGITLFDFIHQEQALKLKEHQIYESGLVQLTYEK